MTNPRQILEQRGIYEEAMKAGWAFGASYFEYDIYNLDEQVIGRRGKAYPNQDIAKYIWVGGKPKDPQADYYIPKGTKQAIKDAGGVCFLANGEASLLAMKAAGIHNAIATTASEITVPKTINETLQTLEVAKLINIADKDKAGTTAAAKWRDALRDSGIGYQAKQWPAYLPEKSDFNDLWIYLQFDANKAKEALESCEALILPQPEIKAPVAISSESFSETPQGLIDNIVSVLRGMGWKQTGAEWINGLSIFRSEHNESAGLNIKSGVYHDFATDERLAPSKVAERLGIDWKRYYPERPEKPKRSRKSKTAKQANSEAVSDEPAIDPRRVRQPAIVMEIPRKRGSAWIGQDWLPISWVKAMLHLTHSKSAVVVYALRLHRAVRNREIDPHCFDIATLQSVLGACDEEGIWRKAPRLSTQNFIDTATAWNFLWILDTNLLDTQDKATESINKSKGRPKQYFSINPETDSLRYRLAELLEVELLERLSEKELAPRNHILGQALELDWDESKAWKERTNNPRTEAVSAQIKARVQDVLEDDFALEFTDEELKHPANLRGKLLRMALAPHSRDINDGEAQALGLEVKPKGIQLARGKLAMELGCSESSMSKLYEENHVGTKRIRGWYEVENPNNCDILAELREAPMKLNRELGGVSIGIRMRVTKPYAKKSEYLPLTYMGNAVASFEKWNGAIEKLYIFVEQPSLLWLMNEDEIKAKEAELAAKQADSEADKEVPVSEAAKPEKKARKPSLISGKDRRSKKLSSDWLSEQMAVEVHMYTPYKLQGMAILDNSEAVIASMGSYAELVSWLNRNAAKKAIRSEYSFYTGVEDMEKKEKAVVYFISCELLNKTYVGKSTDVQTTIKSDFQALARKKHDCRALQAAFNEFGKDALSWGVIEEVEADTLQDTHDYWIRKISEEKPFAVFNQGNA